jgi:hypothetical protein
MHINTVKTKHLADELFELYVDSASSLSTNNINYCNLYISLCKDVISQGLLLEENKSDISNLMTRYLSNKVFRRDKVIKETIRGLLKTKTNATTLANLSEKLNNIVIWHKSNSYISKLYGSIRECKLAYNVEDQTDKITEIKDLIGDFKNTIMDIDSFIGKGGPVEKIDFSKKSSIKDAVSMYKDRHVDYILKTGLQGLNKMCGSKGGFYLGESVLFCARQHNYKSSMLRSLAKWINDYSTPPKIPGKQPVILIISFEDIGYMSMMKMFNQMYKSITGNNPSGDMTDEDVVNAIYDYFNRGEFTIVIERYLPDEFGYDDLVRLHEKYTNSGYNIVACIIDYLLLMKKGDGKFSRSGNDVLINQLCNRTCNFFKAVGTTFFTAAQLNRGASDIVGSGVPHPVKQFGERHTAGSIGIGREFDFVAYMNIELDDAGRSWLTMQWGKHRYVDDTPEVDKFCAYLFEDPIIGIPDDVHSNPAFVRNIHSNPTTSKIEHIDIESILGIK